MKRRVHWLAAIVITLIVATVIALQEWYWGGFPKHELPLLFLFGLAFFVPPVALYLSPLYVPPIRRLIHDLSRAWPYIPGRAPTIALSVVMSMVCVCWARSYWLRERLVLPLSNYASIRCTTQSGVIRISYRRISRAASVDFDFVSEWIQYKGQLPSVMWKNERRVFLGIQIHRMVLGFPLWSPPVILGILVLIPLITGLRRYRRVAGCRCRNCSYDLTGNRSGTCPECGTEVLPAQIRELAACG